MRQRHRQRVGALDPVQLPRVLWVGYTHKNTSRIPPRERRRGIAGHQAGHVWGMISGFDAPLLSAMFRAFWRGGASGA